MGIGVFVGLPILSREYLYCFTGTDDYVVVEWRDLLRDISYLYNIIGPFYEEYGKNSTGKLSNFFKITQYLFLTNLLITRQIAISKLRRRIIQAYLVVFIFVPIFEPIQHTVSLLFLFRVGSRSLFIFVIFFRQYSIQYRFDSFFVSVRSCIMR